MVPVKSLQLHVTHACNLQCEGCTHYSNQGHKGLLSLEEADAWMTPWGSRLRPRDVSLLGGEPTIHPELAAFVGLARRHFPQSQVRVVTNGFFLDRHPELPRALAEAGNARLDISIHHESRAYARLLEANVALVQRWIEAYGIQVKIQPSFGTWTRQYHGVGADMTPFTDGDPQSSWDHCQAAGCFQLHEGKVWKCAPLAYLPMQHAKYGLSDEWTPYLGYQPLPPECSGVALRAFVTMGAEAYCAMCPAQPVPLSQPWPLPTPGPVA